LVSGTTGTYSKIGVSKRKSNSTARNVTAGSTATATTASGTLAVTATAAASDNKPLN
jgi:hypothetical protein